MHIWTEQSSFTKSKLNNMTHVQNLVLKLFSFTLFFKCFTQKKKYCKEMGPVWLYSRATYHNYVMVTLRPIV